MGNGRPWDLTSMQKTAGYANRPRRPLGPRAPTCTTAPSRPSGICWPPPPSATGDSPPSGWATGSSTPTTWASRPTSRPSMGDRPPSSTPALAGNSNQGHTGPVYGTDLTDEDKKALIAYLKTL
ncbi:MAG: hypothetical protein R3F43_20840 [bacterium]